MNFCSIWSLFRSTGFGAFAVRIASVGTVFLGNMFITRLLSRSDVGEYFSLWAVVYFLAFIGHMGIRTAAVRWIATGVEVHSSDAIGTGVRTALILNHVTYSCVSLLYLFLMLATRVIMGQSLEFWPLVLGALWIMSVGLLYSLSEVFRGIERHVEAGIQSGLLANCLNSLVLAVVFCSGTHLTLTHAVTLSVLANFVNYLFMMIRLTHILRQYHGTGTIPATIAFRESIPMLITSLAGALLTLTDVAILGWFAPPGDVAIYAASSRMAAFVNILNQVSLAVLAPRIARLVARRESRELKQALLQSFWIMLIPTMLIVAALVLTGPQLLKAAFGSGYERGSTTLATISISNCLAAFAAQGAMLLMFSGNQSVAMRLSLLTALVAFVFQIGGAKYGGMTGVACGTLASSFVLLVLRWMASREFLRGFSVSCAAVTAGDKR